MRYEQDGIALWFDTPDAPAPSGTVPADDNGQVSVAITAAVRPPSASNSVQVVYRLNGGPVASIDGVLDLHDPQQKAQYYVVRLPTVQVGDTVDYSVTCVCAGRELPAPANDARFVLSFQVVEQPHSTASDLVRKVPENLRPLATSRIETLHTTALDNSLAGRVLETASSPLPQHSLGIAPIEVSANVQRMASVVDPLSEVGGKLSETLVPFRTAAISKFYLGMDRVRANLGVIKDALAVRTLPPKLIGILLQPDCTEGRWLQVQFDPSSLGSTGPKVTVVTDNLGSFTLTLPHGLSSRGTAVSLTVHGANGNAVVTIPMDQIAANGLFGSVMLPIRLNPLPVSIMTALSALLPAQSSTTGSGQTSTAAQLHVVKLGEDESCELVFKANSAVDQFPYGIFFRLVEPQTSLPHVVQNISLGNNFFPLPSYQNLLPPAGSSVSYVDRIPIEQPLSVDGFRDQIMGVSSTGTVTADETVPMAGSLGLGYTLWMSQRWTFQGLALGDLVYSLALAPGEQQQVAIFERVDTATVQESEFFTEEETESQAALSDTSTQATFTSAFHEAVNAGSQFSTTSTSASAATGGSSSVGIISFGGSGSSGMTATAGQGSEFLQGQRNTTQQAAQNTHSAAQQQAAARRSAAHTSMRMATASESESVTTKVITNHNHTRALTLQYWEVLRLYDVTTAVDGLTLTCLVPMQVVRFLPPGQTLTLSDTSLVSSRGQVMARYSNIIKQADVLARALPRRFQYGLSLLQQFASDPTANVEPFGGTAEDVIQFSLTGTFVPCEDVSITAITKRNTRVGPVKLVNSASIPQDKFTSKDELLAWLNGLRQGVVSASASLNGSLALPPSLNRSDIVGFEFNRSFRKVDYTLVAPEMAAINTLTDLFHETAPPWISSLFPSNSNESVASSLARTTVNISPADLESSLGGPLLSHFQASLQEFDATGASLAAVKGETYANDSLNGVELPAQPYPVPAVQIGPVLRFNQILEIENMAQHVVRNTVLYSKTVWSSMSPDERAILLEHYTIGVPSNGVTDASQMVPLLNCVENRVLGFFGNSMILPFMIPQGVATDMEIDPGELQNGLLAYQQESFTAPQSTIALPTRGVLGEAVLGRCSSAEKIDITRFWNWADAPADAAPTISPVTLPTTSPSIAAGLTAPNTLTNLPPLINNILTAPTPDTSLLQALSKSAASQQDFSPALTGADQLSSLMTNAQNTANAARGDALKSSTDLISKAMTTAGNLISQQMTQASQAMTEGSKLASQQMAQQNQQKPTQPTQPSQSKTGQVPTTDAKTQTPDGKTQTELGTDGTTPSPDGNAQQTTTQPATNGATPTPDGTTSIQPGTDGKTTPPDGTSPLITQPRTDGTGGTLSGSSTDTTSKTGSGTAEIANTDTGLCGLGDLPTNTNIDGLPDELLGAPGPVVPDVIDKLLIFLKTGTTTFEIGTIFAQWRLTAPEATLVAIEAAGELVGLIGGLASILAAAIAIVNADDEGLRTDQTMGFVYGVTWAIDAEAAGVARIKHPNAGIEVPPAPTGVAYDPRGVGDPPEIRRQRFEEGVQRGRDVIEMSSFSDEAEDFADRLTLALAFAEFRFGCVDGHKHFVTQLFRLAYKDGSHLDRETWSLDWPQMQVLSSGT